MVNFVNFLDTFDKVLDCIPVISTVTNSGILLYQLIHKVNKTANPVKTSWKDDIKIHLLSKDSFFAGIFMIPVLGNITTLIIHHFDNFPDYLDDAITGSSWGIKKHSYEVAALDLARHPNRQEHQLIHYLQHAANEGNEEIVRLILDSNKNWSSSAIRTVLSRCAKDVKIFRTILEKCLNFIPYQDAKFILTVLAAGRDNSDLIKCLIEYYPGIDELARGQDLVHGEQLRRRFPNLETRPF